MMAYSGLTQSSSHSHPYESLGLVRRSVGNRWLFGLIVFILLAVTAGLIWIPWQQTVIGAGQVWVYSPMDRPQSIEAMVSGRLTEWRVSEGQAVTAGQLLGRLQDLDKSFLAPNYLKQLQAQKLALQTKLAASQQEVSALGGMMASLEGSRQAVLPSLAVKQAQTANKITLTRQKLRAAQQALKTAQLNYNRRTELLAQGLRSQRDFELSQLDWVKAQADVKAAEQELAIATQDQDVAGFEIAKGDADTLAKVSETAAKLASAQEGVASTQESLQKIETQLETLAQRVQFREIRAPRSGIVVRQTTVGTGETVKEGTQLALIVPDTKDQSVELSVADFDAPLVHVGSPVRLQFSGWAAFQFSGWPSSAVGTFAGRVAVVDAVEDGGKGFRVIVKPDTVAIAEGREEPWPDSRHLRPGTGATGWILLNTVPLGYELWRQFNAFPPTLDAPSMKEAIKPRQAVPKLKSSIVKIKAPKSK
jgi:membrane fusion protein, adhesin transport system